LNHPISTLFLLFKELMISPRGWRVSGTSTEGEGINAYPECNRRNGFEENHEIKKEGLLFDVIEAVLKFYNGILL